MAAGDVKRHSAVRYDARAPRVFRRPGRDSDRAGAGASAGGGKKDDDVIDAEYEVKE